MIPLAVNLFPAVLWPCVVSVVIPPAVTALYPFRRSDDSYLELCLSALKAYCYRLKSADRRIESTDFISHYSLASAVREICCHHHASFVKAFTHLVCCFIITAQGNSCNRRCLIVSIVKWSNCDIFKEDSGVAAFKSNGISCPGSHIIYCKFRVTSEEGLASCSQCVYIRIIYTIDNQF